MAHQRTLEHRTLSGGSYRSKIVRVKADFYTNKELRETVSSILWNPIRESLRLPEAVAMGSYYDSESEETVFELVFNSTLIDSDEDAIKNLIKIARQRFVRKLEVYCFLCDDAQSGINTPTIKADLLDCLSAASFSKFRSVN